jgi:hypothetical protein
MTAGLFVSHRSIHIIASAVKQSMPQQAESWIASLRSQ